MKRHVWWLTLLLLGAPALAQEPAAPSPEKPKLILWHAYRGAEREALETIIQAHNADPRVGYTLDPLATPYDALVDKITAAVPRGRGPDLFIFAHDTIGDWAEANLLERLDGKVDTTLLNSFLDETVPPLIYRGALYGLPLAFKSAALIYRTDKIAAPPQTTDEMVALAKPLTNADNGTYGLVYESGLLYFHAGWLFGFGGTLFGPDGKPRLDAPENVASLAFAAELANTHKIVPQEVNGALVTALMGDGKAAMAITGPWLFADLPPGAPVAVAPLPIISKSGKRARPFMTAEAVFVNAKGSNKAFALGRS